MLGIIVLAIIVSAIVWIIYIEYKNTQRYNKARAEKHNLIRTPLSTETNKENLEKKETEEQVIVASKKIETKPEPEIITKEPQGIEKSGSALSVEHALPPCDYPVFDHTRSVENLGLSEEEAKEFVCELFSQIETQLPLIKEGVETEDFMQLEKLTHSIKGSASNLGTGGVSDLLADFNTYLQDGTDIGIINNYFSSLETYTQKLKEQYC